jgi:myo-inositol 2-dehydrogenase/D-chiro-inositol 1-dehydrogenase
MRIAVLGTGTLGRFRAATLMRSRKVEWLGMGSSDSRRARQTAKDVGAAYWGTYEELLLKDLDAVIVATESSQHASQVRECIARGLTVLCEKPLAVTLDESVALVRAANDAEVQLQIGFQRRFDAGFREARERIRSNDVGSLYSIRLASHDHNALPERFARTSGGMFRDLHVHDFDLARWLTGDEVEEVFAVGANRTAFSYLKALGDVDTTAIILRMSSGVPVLISGARHDAAGHDVRAEIFGSKDTLGIGYESKTPLTRLGEGTPKRPEVIYDNFLDRFRDAFIEETKSFLRVVEGEESNPCPGKEGVEALMIAEAANRSHREMRVVRLDEIHI